MDQKLDRGPSSRLQRLVAAGRINTPYAEQQEEIIWKMACGWPVSRCCQGTLGKKEGRNTGGG